MVVDNPLSVLCDGPSVPFVIDKGVEQNVFAAIRIARCIHGFSDDVRGEFTNVAVIKFNAVNARVHDRIGVCVPNGIASSVALLPNYCSVRKQLLRGSMREALT